MPLTMAFIESVPIPGKAYCRWHYRLSWDTSGVPVPDHYVVKAGDTLFDIAGQLLGDSRRWPEIWRLNRSQIANPNLIFPGQSLAIPTGVGLESEVALGFDSGINIRDPREFETVQLSGHQKPPGSRLQFVTAVLPTAPATTGIDFFFAAPCAVDPSTRVSVMTSAGGSVGWQDVPFETASGLDTIEGPAIVATTVRGGDSHTSTNGAATSNGTPTNHGGGAGSTGTARVSQRLTDFTKYKGVLPYDSELFGVYQPLLGWKSSRQSRRIAAGTHARQAGILNRFAQRIKPDYRVKFGEDVSITSLRPGQVRETNFDSSVMSAIKAKLPTEEHYDPKVWDELLSSAALTSILTDVVPVRANDLYRQLRTTTDPATTTTAPHVATTEPHITPRLDVVRRLDVTRRLVTGPDDPENTVRAYIANESRTAGMLSELRQQKQHALLHEVFYGGITDPASLADAAVTADPFDTIDPTNQLDRVGLSPIGLAHLFREYFFELDTFLGTPVGHVWVAPGSTVEMAEVHTRRIYQEQTLEQSIQTVRRTEASVTTQDDISDAVKEDNRSGTKFGVSVTANEDWGWGSATETGSFNLDDSQEKAREQVHKSMRQQSKKLTNEITENYKSTFRTITETTDTSSKRYVLTNSTNELINYELRRKMRQVVVQVQDVGSYLCWQTYVDDPGKQLGLAKLVHIGTPPDLSKIPQPQLVVPPAGFSEPLNLTIPFISTDDASNDDDFDDGSETSLGFADATDHILADIPQGPVRCSQSGFRLVGVAVDAQGADARMSVSPNSIKDDGTGGFSFTVHLNHVNFQGQNSIPVKATLNWDPIVDHAAIEAENKKRMDHFTAQEQELFNQAFVTAARERINAAANITARPFADLRDEERIIVYRNLIQNMLTPSRRVPQPHPQTQHVVAELLNSIFDIDKMLYFVAPEWWRPRLHHSSQQLGGLSPVLDPITGNTLSVTPEIPRQDVVAWGEADTRNDSYYITEASKPAREGSSLGWLLQLDGDDLRNAFLNAPWVKAVLPIRPGKERAALSWLQHVEGMGTIGQDDKYMGPEPEWHGIKTVFEVLEILADRVKAKAEAGDRPKDFADPIDDSNTVRATPIDKVYEHGFDPLLGGFKATDPEGFEVFDQWLEILPTDQVVAVEVKYDPKTGRQL
jgi:hypothetical protein